MTNNAIPTFTTGLKVEAIDTIYCSNSHFNHCFNSVHIVASGSVQISDLYFTNFYADRAYNRSLLIEGSTTGLFRGIKFALIIICMLV